MKKNSKSFFFVFFTVALLQSCSSKSIYKESFIAQGETRTSEIKYRKGKRQFESSKKVIYGRVVDRDNYALIDVKIAIGDKVTKTDLEGLFEIKLTDLKVDIIKFQYLGWRTIETNLDPLINKELIVILEPEFILEEQH